jgi:hypothetical protein
MRALLISVAIVLGAVLGCIVGYQVAAYRYAELKSAREQQLEREVALMLTVVVDIAEHREEGETALADWKFSALRQGLENYLRGGGPDPTHFVPAIVEKTTIQ